MIVLMKNCLLEQQPLPCMTIKDVSTSPFIITPITKRFEFQHWLTGLKPNEENRTYTFIEYKAENTESRHRFLSVVMISGSLFLQRTTTSSHSTRTTSSQTSRWWMSHGGKARVTGALAFSQQTTCSQTELCPAPSQSVVPILLMAAPALGQ